MGWRIPPWVGAVLLVAAVAAAYAPVWHAGFVWDDDLHLTANPHIVGPLGLKQIWTTPEANYFPLVLSHLWVLHRIFGLDPLPYHLMSVALHAGCALLLWRALRELAVPGALLGATIWALHPVQAESVAWISELKNTQSALFYLLGLLAFLRWLRTPAPRRIDRCYGGALACAVLAILSKSSTVMLPVVLGLCWWWRERDWQWRWVAWLVPFLACSLAAGLWTIWEQRVHSGASGAEWELGLPGRLALAGHVVWFYVGKLLWPEPLIFIYPRWTIDAARFATWVPTLAAAAVLAGLWLARVRGTCAWFFGAACFVVSLFPVLGFFNVYFFRFSYVGDHLQYLASMAVAAGMGAGADCLLRAAAAARPRVGAMLARVACCAVVAIFAGLTWRQCGTYHSAESLWRDTVDRNPAAWIAHNNLGLLRLEAGDSAGAVAHYRVALRLKPDYAEAHLNLGSAELIAGRVDAALPHLASAARLQPKDAGMQNSYGVALMQVGRREEAAPYFLAAARRRPELAGPHFNLGNVYFHRGDFTAAAAAWTESLRLQPDQPEARNHLGLAWQRLGRGADAIREFTAAIRAWPGYAEAHLNLGTTLLQAGRIAEAITALEQARQLAPQHPEIRNNLGSALVSANRPANAIPHYEAAIQLQPSYAEAHANLAAALARLGRVTEAIAHLRRAIELRPDHAETRESLRRLEAFRDANPTAK
jgi:tetratricopeptide (TPR) repeat protein